MAGQNQQTGFTPERFDIRKPPLKNILKIFVTCGDPAILEQYAHLGRQRFADDVTLTSSGKHFLEFNAKQDSKGNALRLLANQLNVELKHTLAFGDSMNDLSMLKAAGCSLVTSNADPRLTKAMPGLKAIGHHADDAVARYLTSYLNSELVLEND
ncbi:cofprotein, HD superfamily hydrolase [Vibrio ishigakensis]|uniref:Cofprotein, HD superfamily hydrolase n=2 Tax=Vibrio ishigakensis TaxID=1481914 RepID=A0A0B8NS51_9VIBR|nr:cofprotein, HD superfamily hydrolase [Vibrio ishigakensis]